MRSCASAYERSSSSTSSFDPGHAGKVRPALSHDLDLALGRVEAALALEDVLQRADRDFELVEGRLARREPLEPEPGASSVIRKRLSVCLPAKRISS